MGKENKIKLKRELKVCGGGTVAMVYKLGEKKMSCQHEIRCTTYGIASPKVKKMEDDISQELVFN